MWTYAPDDYRCPFCALLDGDESERNRRSDIVYRDDATAALVAPLWWQNNPGHVLVVPVAHIENLYGVPDDVLGRVYATAKRVAIAMKEAYGCDGTSTRQHNEPGSGQDVWHLHVHVFPRYLGDRLYENHRQTRWAAPEERLPYADRLRRALRM
jgi:histidine triad (HIT) family protein